MASVTLAQLRTRAKTRADMTNSSFVADSEWLSFLNASLDELHDLIILQFGNDYYVSESAFTTVSGTSDYALPADFYKLLGVDITLSSVPVALQQWEFKERNYYRNQSLWGGQVPRYRLVGSNLRIYPAPTGAYTGRMFYTPTRTPLAVDADAVNYPGGWEEYAVIDAAIKALNKEESDTRSLMADKAAMQRRVEEAAANRDAGEVSHVSDVEKPWTGFDPYMEG